MKLDIQLFADGKVVIEAEVDTKTFDKQIKHIERQIEILEKYQPGVRDKSDKYGIEENEAKIERLKNQLISLKEQQEKYNNEVEDVPIEELESNAGALENIGFSLNNIIKKVVRWGLAVFGVRSAYNAIRSAMSVISQNDEQLASDIEYIKNALAYTLEPVVRRIVDLVKQLLFYVAYIIKAWTGYNIFENANKSLKKANGQAKTLSKTLAGFDEMNVLSDTSSSGGGGASPSFDLTDMQSMEVPGWIDWIAKNKEAVLGFFGAIATGWALVKGVGFISDLLEISGYAKDIELFLTTHGKTIGGIVLILTGLVLIIEGVIDYLKDPTWDNFIKILGGIALAAAGVLLIFGGVPALITLIVGLIGALVLAIVKNWDKIKETLAKVGNWIYLNVITPVRNFFSGLWNGLKDGAGKAIQWIKDAFSNVKTFIKTKIIDPISNFFGGMWNGIKTGASNGLNNVKSTFSNIFNKIIDGINKFIRGLNKIQINIPDWLGGGNFGFNIREIPRLARGGIVNNPGRGVMMGNYIAGENGAEAVLPLTDDTLQKLANMIPITINLTNTMNGRVISRELQRVQNENDFAYNR